MLKTIFIGIIATALCVGCTQENKTAALESKIKALEKDVEDLKPGLGDIMSTIQLHHEKLYFAGKNNNWDLATFEYHEIQEGFDSASRWHERIEGVETPAAQLLKIKEASMQELEASIEKKSRDSFLTSFAHLTQACNECHTSARHPFIVIQEPKSFTFTNQRFEK